MYLTQPLSNLLARILRSRGIDPATYTLGLKEQAQYTDLINQSLYDAWTSEFWPEIMLIEQRTFAPAWDVSVNYPAGNIVWRDNGVYGPGGMVITAPTFAFYCMSVQQTIGNDPALDTTFTNWTIYFPFVRCIPFDLTWTNPDGGQGTAIDNIMLQRCAMYRNPLMGDNKDWIQGLDIWERSIRFPTPHMHMPTPFLANGTNQSIYEWGSVNKPYIKFRPICPVLSAVAWNSATPYAVGNTVYFVTTATGIGHTYVCILSNTNQQPDSQPTYWVPVDVPQLFYNYIALRCKAELIAEAEGRDANMGPSDQELDRLRNRYINNTGVETDAVWDNSDSGGRGNRW